MPCTRERYTGCDDCSTNKLQVDLLSASFSTKRHAIIFVFSFWWWYLTVSIYWTCIVKFHRSFAANETLESEMRPCKTICRCNLFSTNHVLLAVIASSFIHSLPLMAAVERYWKVDRPFFLWFDNDCELSRAVFGFTPFGRKPNRMPSTATSLTTLPPDTRSRIHLICGIHRRSSKLLWFISNIYFCGEGGGGCAVQLLLLSQLLRFEWISQKFRFSSAVVIVTTTNNNAADWTGERQEPKETNQMFEMNFSVEALSFISKSTIAKIQRKKNTHRRVRKQWNFTNWSNRLRFAQPISICCWPIEIYHCAQEREKKNTKRP